MGDDDSPFRSFLSDQAAKGQQATNPLGEFGVRWDDIALSDVKAFENVLSEATREQDVQAHLEANPILLVQSLGGGHGRWVIPKKRLGSEHVTDFMVAEKSSIGFEWYAVELETPTARLFTKSGDPTSKLSHAIRQIQDWRVWPQQNQNYASRPRAESGLGLTDITPDVEGLILIGRRGGLAPETSKPRRQMSKDARIQIHTYDWVLETARSRARAVHPASDSLDNSL